MVADVGLVTDGTQQLGHLQWHGIMPVLALCDTQRNFWVHLGILSSKQFRNGNNLNVELLYILLV